MTKRYYKTLEELRTTEGCRVDRVENMPDHIIIFFNQYPKSVLLPKEILGKEYDNKFDDITSSKDFIYCLDIATRLI